MWDGRGLILTRGVLHRRPHPWLPCLGVGAWGDEFVDFVRFLENLFEVDALDCGEAIFDEEGVGLPVLRAGTAICRCEVFDGVQVGERVEGSCKCRQGREQQEDE